MQKEERMYLHGRTESAELCFYYGAMNSGKTMHLLSQAYNFEERGMSVRLLKPKRDTKGEARIVSRIGPERQVDLLIEQDTNLLAYLTQQAEHNQGLRCVLVDEVQFCDPKHIDQLLMVTTDLRLSVLCYGLRADFRTHAFPASVRLFELATHFQELPTICRCGSSAFYNARLVNGQFVSSGDQVAIDGQGIAYEPLCVACYQKEVGLPT
jgi:thymidine kinase